MIGNYKLANRLSEAYANGEIGRSFGGNYPNVYQTSDFNNYNDPYMSVNNLGSNEITNRFIGNQTTMQQQAHFDEISRHIMDENDALTAQRNANLLNFQNSLTNTFSGNSRAQMNPQLMTRGGISPQMNPQLNNQVIANNASQQLSQYVPAQQVVAKHSRCRLSFICR